MTPLVPSQGLPTNALCAIRVDTYDMNILHHNTLERINKFIQLVNWIID